MRRRTKIGALGSAGLIAIALFSPLSATADIEGTFHGAADADLVEARFLTHPADCFPEGDDLLNPDAELECTGQVLQAQVGDSDTGSNSAGGLSNDFETDLVSYGHGSNVDPQALNAGDGAAIDEELVVSADAYLPGGPTEDSNEGGSEENELFAGTLFEAEASATDVSDGNTECPDGSEIRLSHGTSRIADLALFPNREELNGADAVSIEGVSFAHSQVDLVDALVDGEGYGVRSSAAVELATLTLLDQLNVEITQPSLVGTHNGDTFSSEYTAPVVTINDETIEGDGELLETLETELLDAILDGLSENQPLLRVTVDIAQQDDVVIDGNTASVSDLVLIEVELLSGVEGQDPVEVLSLSIGDLKVTSVAPEGGVIIDCANPPLTVEKDGPESAEPGETFTYTIDVTNETGCDATDVIVTDEITGPDGFEVTSTSPSADSVGNGTVTWNVGDMAADETQTFTVDVTVPESATAGDMFEDTATASGNCDGRALPLGSDTLEGPAVQTAAARTQSLPRTGGGFALLGIAAAAGAGFLRRR